MYENTRWYEKNYNIKLSSSSNRMTTFRVLFSWLCFKYVLSFELKIPSRSLFNKFDHFIQPVSSAECSIKKYREKKALKIYEEIVQTFFAPNPKHF